MAKASNVKATLKRIFQGLELEFPDKSTEFLMELTCQRALYIGIKADHSDVADALDPEALSGCVTKEDAVQQLEAISSKGKHDPEAAHSEAVEVLTAFLESNGFSDVAESYKKVWNIWYR